MPKWLQVLHGVMDASTAEARTEAAWAIAAAAATDPLAVADAVPDLAAQLLVCSLQLHAINVNQSHVSHTLTDILLCSSCRWRAEHVQALHASVTTRGDQSPCFDHVQHWTRPTCRRCWPTRRLLQRGGPPPPQRSRPWSRPRPPPETRLAPTRCRMTGATLGK